MATSARAVGESDESDRSDMQTACAGNPEGDLDAIIDEILASPSWSDASLDRIQRRHPKDGRGFYNKREILARFRTRGSDADEARFTERLRTCPTRSVSGVLPVTVLTKPFPCPGRCVFCPSDVRMPKSYVSNEPGCQRAESNAFDPYLQALSRLTAYRDMGHPTDKVELIVLGGTWSHYPKSYRRWFVGRLFDALNDFGDGARRSDCGGPRRPEVAAEPSATDVRGRYNRYVAASLYESDDFSPTAFVETTHRNESAATRCVGLSIETRPDCIDRDELRTLRELGVTKVQLGIQSTSDDVLRKNQRGHDVAATRHAMCLLRSAGFKLHGHWMANLLGSDPEADVADFEKLFFDPALRPDELKVYPCSLLDTAELVAHHRRGDWHPYDHETLTGVLVRCLAAVPRSCRVTRMIRDIPSTDILVGNRRTNLREDVEKRARRERVPLREIRGREIRGDAIDARALTLKETRYTAGRGDEIFLEWTDEGDRIAGFLRLHCPREEAPLPELVGEAIIREVHVYGQTARLGSREKREAQHGGLGAALIERAVSLARSAGYRSLAVISAVGTRGYYRRLGFVDGELYQHRAL